MTYPIGQIPNRISISNITNSDPCQVTTSIPHGFQNMIFVRLTELNGCVPIPFGEDQLNNLRFRIIVTGNTTFTLQDPITFKDIDSTTYPPYNNGGSCNAVPTNFIYYPPAGVPYPN